MTAWLFQKSERPAISFALGYGEYEHDVRRELKLDCNWECVFSIGIDPRTAVIEMRTAESISSRRLK